MTLQIIKNTTTYLEFHADNGLLKKRENKNRIKKNIGSKERVAMSLHKTLRKQNLYSERLLGARS